MAGLGYAAILSAFINVLQLTVPLYMLQVHDRVLNSRSMDTLAMLSILAGGALILYGLLEFIRSQAFQVMGGRLVRKLNGPVLAASIRASAREGTSKAAQSLRDLAELRSFLTGHAVSAPLEAAWSPIFLVVLFLLHPGFGIVGVVSILILVISNIALDISTRSLLTEANKANVEAIGNVAGQVRHAEVIESMGMLPALSARWRLAQLSALELLETANRRGKVIATVTRTIRYGMQLFVLALGCILAIRQEISSGAMIASTIVMGRLLMPFDSVVENGRQWVMASGAWKRVRELIATEGADRQTMPTTVCNGDLVVDKLIYAAAGQDVPIIKGVSFSLSPGEVLGVIGPSAAGKSTLARLLVGIVKPTAGGVYLDGNSVYLWERESFGQLVGYLPQSVSLLDGTIRDNIARMDAGDPRAVIEAARIADVHEMIGRLPLGYDTPVGDARLTLSGGQRQRVALARCLYGHPRLIVLDEPNANLDATGEAALIRAIRAAKADGAIVVMIAHRPAIMEVADKLLVLENGRVSQFGPRTDIVSPMNPKRQAPNPSPAIAQGGDRR
ncbi:ABC transporter ATP-binding protein [Kaistia sp. 32K]|uniref:type I secretion system permease/ATPase n=1 Tax=Kaistia sp. 32K TaxID=2795690 RepID=UPI0019379BFA|nr:type I secretion system permease/ATPase [Kaistia sp. 32K]BCP53273.1 ABC transporter ATP-binding protein [Kaistia sp. 32K]